MVTIGVDPHKQTHTAAAVNSLRWRLDTAQRQRGPAGGERSVAGMGSNAGQRAGVGGRRTYRNVSGSLERFLIDRGERIVRLAPQLMADARRGVRTRGKSDPIDALAITRAALREGTQRAPLPTARLAGPEREIRQLALYRERLLDMRTRL